MASAPSNGSVNGNAAISGSSTPFVAALKDFKEKLKKQEARDLGLTTIDDLKTAIDRLQTEQHARRTLKNFGRLRGFIEATTEFGKIIEVYCQVHEVVAFIWVRPVLVLAVVVLVLPLRPLLPSLLTGWPSC
jgi:hypothetical protein